MYIVIYFSICLYIFGVYMLLSDIMKFPAMQTSKDIVSFYGREKKAYKIDILLDELASMLSNFIPIDEYKRKKLLATLKTAGINETPEKYIASAWIKTLLPLVIAIPLRKRELEGW